MVSCTLRKVNPGSYVENGWKEIWVERTNFEMIGASQWGVTEKYVYVDRY